LVEKNGKQKKSGHNRIVERVVRRKNSVYAGFDM